MPGSKADELRIKYEMVSAEDVEEGWKHMHEVCLLDTPCVSLCLMEVCVCFLRISPSALRVCSL